MPPRSQTAWELVTPKCMHTPWGPSADPLALSRRMTRRLDAGVSVPQRSCAGWSCRWWREALAPPHQTVILQQQQVLTALPLSPL